MNKKKIFGSIVVLAIAVIAAFNVNVNTKEEGLSDISLANVEALAKETVYIYCKTPPLILICVTTSAGTFYGEKL